MERKLHLFLYILSTFLCCLSHIVYVVSDVGEHRGFCEKENLYWIMVNDTVCVCVWGLYIQMRMPAADFYHIQEGKGNRIPTMSKEKEVALRWKSVAREYLLLLTGLSVQYRATSHPHWNQTLLLKFKPWLNFSFPLKWFTVGKETRFYLIATKSVNSVDYSRVACLW